MRRFILFYDKQHPQGMMGAGEVEVFLAHLAVFGRVAAAQIWYGCGIMGGCTEEYAAVYV
ncbi:hypothetical protein [Nitrosomonas sp.]|uniref:hypothetical protein n=1 Tax=Nitrosomonas sp. TaxID=42353 RepID=UPI00341EE03C